MLETTIRLASVLLAVVLFALEPRAKIATTIKRPALPADLDV